MYILESFSLSDMTRCGTDLRQMAEGASSGEEVAQRMVSYLYENFEQKSGDKALSLVRIFMTHTWSELDAPLKKKVTTMLPATDKGGRDLKCLVLMATAGSKPEWNDRHKSVNHKVFPLPSEAFVRNLPMIAQLFNQFGLKLEPFLFDSPVDSVVLDKDQASFNVFYVPEAGKCPYLPVQDDFINENGIRSVLGFGGLLGGNSLFAVILFSKVFISLETALMFKPLALSCKNALLQVSSKKIFQPHS